MKKILLLFLCAFVGCTVTKNLKSGCYGSENENLVVSYYLKLNPDSSYLFYFNGDMSNSMQEGHWMTRSGKLILNSNIQPEASGYYKEIIGNIESKLQLILFDINGKPLTNENHVYIKQKSAYLSPVKYGNNIYQLSKDKLSGEFIVGIGSDFKEVKVNVKNSAISKIEVYLVPDKKGFFQTNLSFKIKDSLSFSSKHFLFKKTNCKM